MMPRLLAALLAAAACAAAWALPQEPSATAPSFEQEVLPLLDRYCSFCHDGAEGEAELDLLGHATEASALEDPQLWQRVKLQVAGEIMPPSKRKEQPNAHERATILRWIDEVSDPRTAAGPALPHAPVLRRLNLLEYRNTVRDLTGVDYPAQDLFPADGVALGFDNLGSALTLSDAWVEKYFEAAERIAEAAIVAEDPSHPPVRRIGGDELGGNLADGSAGLFASGTVGARLRFPRAGEYLVRIQAWGQQAGPEPCRMKFAIGGLDQGTVEVRAERGAPQIVEYRTRVEAGPQRLDASFVNDYYQPNNPDPAQRDRNLYVDWIEVSGPLDPPPLGAFQRDLFARFGAELGRGRERAMLEWLARRAWRRPPTKEEVDRLDALSAAEEPLESALRSALTALLASPHFIFRFELLPARSGGADASVRDLNAHELAARLSYFLWSSAPDEELNQLADDGRLLRPEILLLQAERLLKHARSHALATSFAAQWLQTRNLERASPDPVQFPEFTPSLRAAMGEETLRLFEFVLREDLSIWELLESDRSFLNEELAAHYGVPGVSGPEMRLVSMTNTPRCGLLGHAGVLTVTSTPVRTAVVKRGKFILENLLGRPLPPPPPGVDSLALDAASASPASMRERLARHRADPACGVCHNVMDPLGFALENYGPTGGWRSEAEGFPVDSSGVLPGGKAFAGPEELVRVLRQDGGLPRCLTEKLLIYGLGRAPAAGDAAAVSEILRGLDPEHPTLTGIVLGIIESPLFRQRTLQRR